MKKLLTISIFLTVFSMNAQWTYNANGTGVQTNTNTASGIYSTAMGRFTTASANQSTAMGQGTIASGIASTAMGYITLASGDFSTAMGNATTASDYGSLSIGTFNTLQTTNATAFDLANRALVIGNGTSFGNESDALTVLFDGTTSIAGSVTAPSFIGDGSQLTNLPNNSGWSLNPNGTGVQSATNTANGFYSTAMGSQTTASGDYSTAMGLFTTASGYASTAMGNQTTANGFYSTAMGSQTTASGDYSTAMGRHTTASGVYSTAMGAATIASGVYSTAMGLATNASGDFSTAMGNATTASDYGSLSIGTFNTLQTTNANSFDLANRALVIGNGTFGNESDALTVLFDGTTTIAGSVTAPSFIGDGSQLTNAGTDDQAITYDSVTNVVTLEDGGTIDLSALNNSGTDDQQLTIAGNSLNLEDGGAVDLSGYLDNTDDQAITYDAVTNVVTLEDGGTIDLSALNNSGTDDQQLTLAGNSLNLEDGGAVDLSTYLDNTDNQNISGSGFAGTTLTIGIEGGTSETVDLSPLMNSGTDDQQLTLTGNSLNLEDGGTVDLSSYLDNTDDQVLANFILSTATSNLSLAIQGGNVVSVNLAPLLEDLETENAAQQAQIDAQQALIDDLITRMEAREECECTGPLGVGDFNAPTDGARLLQNVPNPFDNSTSIGYFIPLIYSKANIVISSSLGQILQNIPITRFGEGSISVEKDRMSAAIYYYTLYVDGKQIDTKRMIVE